jgi:hypothetical protein
MDRDLIEAARNRDREAFADLIRTRLSRLFTLSHRILRDVDRAEDALQEALVIAWRDLPGLRDPDRFDAWLHRLVVRACLVEAKRELRRISNLLQLDRRRSGVGSPAQALQFAPQALARPALPSYERDRWPGLRHDGRAVVHVAGRGDGGPDARLDRPQDLDDALAIGDERLHPVTRSYLRRRLCRQSIHKDVATVAQPGRERAGLHEAHRAQPTINTRLVGGEGSSHAS